LKNKLSGQCICGYFFGTFDNVKEAIVKVKLHFERYHEDFLPFGITDAEALALLKKGMSHGKKLVCSNNSCHFKQNRRIVQQMTN
jgi:hypothetical protein